MPQRMPLCHRTVTQKPLKTHERAILLHRVTHSFNTTSIFYSETTQTAFSISECSSSSGRHRAQGTWFCVYTALLVWRAGRNNTLPVQKNTPHLEPLEEKRLRMFIRCVCAYEERMRHSVVSHNICRRISFINIVHTFSMQELGFIKVKATWEFAGDPPTRFFFDMLRP